MSRRWASMQRRHALLALAGAALAGCGGGDDEERDPPGTDPLPLALGAWWQYDVEWFSGAGPVIPSSTRMRVITATTMADGTVHTLDGNGPLPPRLRRTATEVLTSPAADDPDVLARAIGPYTLLRLPLRGGDSWLAVERTVMLTDDSGASPPVPWDIRITVDVRPADVVSTAVGRFRGALQVTTSWVYAPPLVAAPAFGRRDDWIVPGIGIVRSTSSGYPVNGLRPYSRSFNLTAFGTA